MASYPKGVHTDFRKFTPQALVDYIEYHCVNVGVNSSVPEMANVRADLCLCVPIYLRL